MKKLKMLWVLIKPMLAAAGITKPSDVGKVVKPLYQILEDLRTLEVAQLKEQQRIGDSLEALFVRQSALEDDAAKAKRVRSRLEELLGD